jgi:hypothetical protein
MNTVLEITGDAAFMGSGSRASRSAGMTSLETWAGQP